MTSNASSKKLILFLLFAAILALGLAYISQYFFGLQPCQLCLYQRWPFFAIIVLCLLTPIFKTEKFRKNILSLCAFVLFVNCIIAFYHVGVEKKIFVGPTTCSTNSVIEENDLEKLKEEIMATNAIKCDEPQFIFLGLSMAAWNMIYCAFLFLIILLHPRLIILQILRK